MAQLPISTGSPEAKADLDTNFGNAQDNFTEIYNRTEQAVLPIVCDGTTDNTIELNGAIAEAAIIGGVVRLPPGVLCRASGILPKSNVTLDLNGSTIKNINAASTAVIHYNSDVELTNFNIINGVLDGNNLAQNIINITQPTPAPSEKTWSYSTLFNVKIQNSTAIGIYCPIPGRVRLIASTVQYNDIGIAFDREHLDIYNSSIEYNRIGARTTGNHFAWVHAVFAHNTEKGVTTVGAGLGTYTDIYEAAIIGSTFLGNGTIDLEGPLLACRVSECRFSDTDTHISQPNGTVVNGNRFAGSTVYAVDGVGARSIISDNYFSGVGGVRSASGANAAINDNFFYSLTGTAIYWDKPVRGSVSGNNIATTNVAIYVNAAVASGGWVIDGNKIYNTTTKAIDIVGTGTHDLNDIQIINNSISTTGLEALVISGGVNAFGAIIGNNKIVDANISNTATISAVVIGKNIIAGTISGNIIRNSTAGHAHYAIDTTGAGTGADTLFANNVARGMGAAYSYVKPASATAANNIGTIAP